MLISSATMMASTTRRPARRPGRVGQGDPFDELAFAGPFGETVGDLAAGDADEPAAQVAACGIERRARPPGAVNTCWVRSSAS